MKTARHLEITARFTKGTGAAIMKIKENDKETVCSFSGSHAEVLDRISEILRKEEKA